MAPGTPNTKSQILALLALRKRGMIGDAAISAWIVNSLEVLLQAELQRIEKRETDAT